MKTRSYIAIEIVYKHIHPQPILNVTKREFARLGHRMSLHQLNEYGFLTNFFRENCLFCGEEFLMSRDPKHPSRWCKAILCRTADRPGRHSFKEAVSDACLSQKDEWGKEVEVRLAGAVSGLDAADTRYHDDCRKKFMGKQTVKSSSKESVEEVDHAFDATVSEMKSSCEYGHQSRYLVHTREMIGPFYHRAV